MNESLETKIRKRSLKPLFITLSHLIILMLSDAFDKSPVVLNAIVKHFSLPVFACSCILITLSSLCSLSFKDVLTARSSVRSERTNGIVVRFVVSVVWVDALAVNCAAVVDIAIRLKFVAVPEGDVAAEVCGACIRSASLSGFIDDSMIVDTFVALPSSFTF